MVFLISRFRKIAIFVVVISLFMFPHFSSWRPWLITPARVRLSVNNGGEGGIRTHETLRSMRFPSALLRPLGHLSYNLTHYIPIPKMILTKSRSFLPQHIPPRFLGADALDEPC